MKPPAQGDPARENASVAVAEPIDAPSRQHHAIFAYSSYFLDYYALVENGRTYSKSYGREWRTDAAVHYAGLLMAALAVPTLIFLAVLRHPNVGTIMAVSVYGTTLTAMLAASAVYNITGQHRWTKVLKRLDHSAIYLKIAGSFTPLVALTGGAGLPFLAGLWGVALGGTSLKMLAPDRLRWLGLALYLGMGWIGCLAGAGVFTSLSVGAMWLIGIGGVLYTLGVVFFLWEALPYHTTIWHAVVLVASALIYAAILIEVLRVNPDIIDGLPDLSDLSALP